MLAGLKLREQNGSDSIPLSTDVFLQISSGAAPLIKKKARILRVIESLVGISDTVKCVSANISRWM